MKHTLSVLVEDESGALSRIAGLFARRGFNIDSLAVGPAETNGQSRLTMVVEGDEHTLQQMSKQLDKLVNVLQVLDLSQLPAVERELMLMKVSAPAEQRGAILELVQVFRATVVDVADDALTLEVVGDPGKLVALERLMAPYGILEIARTGKVALERASGVNTELLKAAISGARVPARWLTSKAWGEQLRFDQFVILFNRIHHFQAIGHTTEHGIPAIQLRQRLQGDIKLSAGRIGRLGASHGKGSPLMTQRELLQITGIGALAAIARLIFILIRQLKGNESRLPTVWIHKTSCSVLRFRGIRITRCGIATLHDKWDRLTNHPVKHGAVVHTSFNKVHKIASGHRCRITIEFKLDHPTGGCELNIGLPLKTGTTGLAAARRD